MATPSQTVHVDGVDVTLSNPDKVLFPAAGVTKADLVAYYLAVGEPLLEAMGGRPVLLQRFPNGVGKQSFFQKRIPDSAPEWLQTTTVATPNGTESRALVVADLAHVVWAVNLASLGFHVWPYLADDPAHVDELRIDLDPSPGCASPRCARRPPRSGRCSTSWASTGAPRRPGRGIHVYVALEARWDAVAVRQAAVALARELERRRPDLLTAAWWKEERGTRVFVDFNQNAPHKTVFGAWSARARTGAQVSCLFASGRPRRHRSRGVHGRHRARAPRRRRRPVGRHARRAADDRRSARVVLARHRRRADGRPVAARVPEDAAGTSPRGAQPSRQARRRGLERRRQHRRRQHLDQPPLARRVRRHGQQRQDQAHHRLGGEVGVGPRFDECGDEVHHQLVQHLRLQAMRPVAPAAPSLNQAASNGRARTCATAATTASTSRASGSSTPATSTATAAATRRDSRATNARRSASRSPT
ncbi:MAG: hypothetical protein R2699_03510 [Acidimicrobiales bacterium]